MTAHPLVVLLPGTLCTQQLWEEQVCAWSDSADVQHVALSAASMSGMVAQVLASSERDLVLVGCSLGGIVALAAHRTAPQRIRGLALIATTARPPRAEQLRTWSELAAAAQHDLDAVVRDRLLPSLLRPGRSSAGAERAVMEMAHQVGAGTYRAQLAAQATRVDERPALTLSDVPVLVLAAEDDPLCPVDVHAEMAGLAPRSTFDVIGECGHLAPLDRPAAVRDAVAAWLPQAVGPRPP